MADGLSVQCMRSAEAADRGLLPGIEKIFFDTAARGYAPGAEREAFLERWLGRYLATERDILLVGVTAQDDVWGYLVGTMENAAESLRFMDTPYFRGAFREACRAYPAHLHINLDARYRNRGLGRMLIERFVQHASDAGVRGIHAVTARGMRNVTFYERCGFSEQASVHRDGRDLVFLGRAV